MRVMWLSDPSRDFEIDWIKELLSKTKQSPEIEFVNEDFLVCDTSTVLICGRGSKYMNLIEQFHRKSIPYGVIFLSDEYLVEKMEWINNTNCFFVARNYYNPRQSSHPKVWCFGLGYKNNFESTQVQGNHRKYVCSFAGAAHSKARIKGIQTFQKIQPSFFHVTDAFNSSEGISTEQYKQILFDSTFALCPQGHANNDSFRICESLMAGCIPIVLRSDSIYTYIPSYWHAIFGAKNVPFVIGNNWKNCYKKVQFLIKNEEELLKKQESCHVFWVEQMNKWVKSFEESFSTLENRNHNHATESAHKFQERKQVVIAVKKINLTGIKKRLRKILKR